MEVVLAAFVLFVINLTAVSAQTPTSPTVPSILVVTDHGLAASPGIDEEKVQSCLRQQGVGLADYLKTTGMTVIARDGATMVLSESVWQEEKMRRSLDVLHRLATAVHSDGTFDLKADPEATAYLDAYAIVAGNTLDTDSAVAASPIFHLNLKVGDRTVGVDVNPGLSSNARAELLKHPVRPRKDSDVKGLRRSDLIVTRPRIYAINAFGLLAGDDKKTYELFRKALDLAESHFEGFEEVRHEAYRTFNAKALGFSLAASTGKSVSGLPDSLQKGVNAELTVNYRKYGFGSWDEAQSFMTSATFVGGNTYFTISVGLPASETGGAGGIGTAELD